MDLFSNVFVLVTNGLLKTIDKHGPAHKCSKCGKEVSFLKTLCNQCEESEKAATNRDNLVNSLKWLLFITIVAILFYLKEPFLGVVLFISLFVISLPFLILYNPEISAMLIGASVALLILLLALSMIVSVVTSIIEHSEYLPIVIISAGVFYLLFLHKRKTNE